MARWLMSMFILLMFAQSALAVVDPRPDVLGVYFDEAGNQLCNDLLIVGVPFSVWFVYTNPTVGSILGFEAGFHTTAEFIMLGIYPPCGINWIVPPDLDNLYVACPTSLATSLATPLFRIEYMYLGVENREAVFYLEKARESVQPGNNPQILLADGSLLEAQAGNTAYTTIFCGVSTEEASWGTIKSLYR